MKSLALLCLSFFLAGCAGYNVYADKAMDYACSVEGQGTRLTYRTVRDPEYKAKDRAICARCPGEKELSCTGDPLALPTPPT